MKCPFCASPKSDVVDTRDTEDDRIRRRRECAKCRRRFTTYEEKEEAYLFVIKKDGRREKFDRKKLLGGLERACEKLPVSRDRIEEMANWVESKLRKENKKEIASSKIGELVMQKLRAVDEVAYIRFASVYRSFADIDSFEEALKNLKKRK